MIYTSNYESPIGNLLIASKDAQLIRFMDWKSKVLLFELKGRSNSCKWP